jgi:hypothetical protein
MTVRDEVATTSAVANKEAANKRAVDEAVVKRAVEERDAEEVVAKAAAVEEVAGKTADEAAGAVGESPASSQAPTVDGAKRAAAPPRQPNVPTGVFGILSLSSFLSSPPSFFFFQWGFIL